MLGASDMISVVIRQSLVQLQTPDHMRGRVSAVNSLFIGTSNQLGEFESGVTAAWFGVVPSVVIGGIGTLRRRARVDALFPSLANIDRLEGRAVVTEVAPRAPHEASTDACHFASAHGDCIGPACDNRRSSKRFTSDARQDRHRRSA